MAKQDSGSTVNVEKDKFQIILDVQQFTPDEIAVKTSDKYIIVEGKHEEKQDEHGFVSRCVWLDIFKFDNDLKIFS